MPSPLTITLGNKETPLVVFRRSPWCSRITGFLAFRAEFSFYLTVLCRSAFTPIPLWSHHRGGIPPVYTGAPARQPAPGFPQPDSPNPQFKTLPLIIPIPFPAAAQTHLERSVADPLRFGCILQTGVPDLAHKDSPTATAAQRHLRPGLGGVPVPASSGQTRTHNSNFFFSSHNLSIVPPEHNAPGSSQSTKP